MRIAVAARIAAAALAWGSLLCLASPAAAQHAAAPSPAIHRPGPNKAAPVKPKDLSRLPNHSLARKPVRTPAVWEDAEVPSDGRGVDPSYTYSSDSAPAASAPAPAPSAARPAAPLPPPTPITPPARRR